MDVTPRMMRTRERAAPIAPAAIQLADGVQHHSITIRIRASRSSADTTALLAPVATGQGTQFRTPRTIVLPVTPRTTITKDRAAQTAAAVIPLRPGSQRHSIITRIPASPCSANMRPQPALDVTVSVTASRSRHGHALAAMRRMIRIRATTAKNAENATIARIGRSPASIMTR
ncbi:MAG: hypothetical protein RLZZ366_1792 [Pseudomonadota bacterium]